MASINNRSVMPKRRANRVTTGCEKCKARKLKCDEQKPCCRRCVVGNWKCVYNPPKAWLFEPSRKTTSEHNASLVTSTELRRVADRRVEPFRCQNSICQSRKGSRRSADQNSCRGPLCYASLLGSLKLDAIGEKSLSYYISTYAPSHGVLVTIKDGTNGLLTRLLPWALRDDLILDAVMAESLAYAAEGDLNTKYGSGAMQYRQSAVSKIIRRLSQGCDHATVQAVICLVFTDIRLGFQDHCRAHLQGLRAMVLSCGGLKSLGCDGMQRDIILLFNELFHIFGKHDDPEFCGPHPQPPLLTRFCSFAPEIGARKFGMRSPPRAFRQQALFPWVLDSIVIQKDSAS